MERTDVSGKEAGGGIGSGGEGFIDRSKMRILLCDNDAKSSDEVFTLLCKCSYQVTSVRSPRQVIDALNAEGPDIDIILSEVDLPMSKGFKFLKYIMKDEELRRIPVIMMSAQDEVSIVMKCLKFGAADYLVKPLRTNELLNLWTHMWRRRRMLGLDEKNILNYDFDLEAFDPSDANTNSTTLFSNDTDEKSQKSAKSDLSVSPHEAHEDKANAATGDAPVEIQLVDSMDDWPDVPGISDRLTAQMSSCPKKSELKIGESSAFFTYVKSSFLKSNVEGVATVEDNAPQPLRGENKSNIGVQMIIDTLGHSRREALAYHSQGDDIPGSKSIPPHSMERSCTPPMTLESSLHGTPKVDEVSEVHMHLREESHHGVSCFHPHTAYPYYISGMMNQVMMPSAGPMYQNNLQNHKTTTMVPHYDCMPRCSSHVPGMASFPYYPVSICIQPGQTPAPHTWPSYGNSSSMEGNLNKVDRREAALLKFRQKRKERCFDKKVRYVNRKHLAERRPRVRGQFVRKINGMNVDLNGQPASADYDDDDEVDEDQANRDSSPEDDASLQ